MPKFAFERFQQCGHSLLRYLVKGLLKHYAQVDHCIDILVLACLLEHRRGGIVFKPIF